VDPDLVKFKRTVRVIRRRAADPAFPPEQRQRTLDWIMADITGRRTSTRRGATGPTPGVVKRARHNSYRVKRSGDHGTRHDGPATIRLVNLRSLPLVA